jgi:hypothetical protein
MSEEELKRAEKLRVGVRKGMMPWGRERLAETAYDCALAELKKPHPNNQKVLWHLDCATNLNPKFSEAVDLKERISGKVVTDVDNSSIRSFVRDMIMNDREAGSPVGPTRTGDEKAPVKPSDPSASTSPQDDDPFAEMDGEELPFDYEAPPSQPEADQVLKDSAADSKAATEAAKPSETAKKDEKPVESASTEAQPEKKPEEKAAPKTTVTELPIEEVKPDAPTADDNK